MGPTLLVFDIDGTLMDAGAAGRVAMDRAFVRAFGLPGTSQVVEMAGRTDRAIFAEMAAKGGVRLHAAALARLQREYVQALPAALADHAALLLPGAEALVAALAGDRRCRLALGTGNIEAGARIKLRHFGLDLEFPTGAFGDDSEQRPAVIATALRQARSYYGEEFAAEATVVIGDSALDVAAARAAGMRIMGVATGPAGPGPLAGARPDVVFPDLTDARRIVAWLLD